MDNKEKKAKRKKDQKNVDKHKGRGEYEIVKNVSGSSGAGGSKFLEKWRSETKSKATQCCVLSCSDLAEDGAHVTKGNKQICIVNMCHFHNKSPEGTELVVKKITKFATNGIKRGEISTPATRRLKFGD